MGNAKIAGLTESLNLKGLEFSTGLALFYVFYIAIELPSNLILKKVSAKLVSAFICPSKSEFAFSCSVLFLSSSQESL